MDKVTADRISELLLKNWDPIGIKDTPGAEDEYALYIHEIYEIIRDSSPYVALFVYLWTLETDHMGLTGNKSKTEEFAKFLFNEIRPLVNEPPM